jgi:hypothetical protein
LSGIPRRKLKLCVRELGEKLVNAIDWSAVTDWLKQRLTMHGRCMHQVMPVIMTGPHVTRIHIGEWWGDDFNYLVWPYEVNSARVTGVVSHCDKTEVKGILIILF